MFFFPQGQWDPAQFQQQAQQVVQQHAQQQAIAQAQQQQPEEQKVTPIRSPQSPPLQRVTAAPVTLLANNPTAPCILRAKPHAHQHKTRANYQCHKFLLRYLIIVHLLNTYKIL
jgi:hypothetical protein